jgi:hypothetical protein
VPFYRVGRECGSRVMEGNRRRRWCSIMVVEAAVLGRDRSGQWGVMRGAVAPAISRVEGRGASGGGMRVRT